MKDVTVALVDSGINYEDNFFLKHVKGGKTFIGGEAETYMDDNGHGSLCASAIIKENPNVKLYVEKVLDKDNQSTLDILEESLEALLDQDIQIISLSLTLTEIQRERKLGRICADLSKKGKIIVCTLANGIDKSYPANYQSTIGVKGLILENPNAFWFNRRKRIQAIVDTNPYLLRNNNNSYQLFGKCNSFSTAKFAGILSRIMRQNEIWTKEELEDYLEKETLRTNWTGKDFIESKRYPQFSPKKSYNFVLIKIISRIIMEYLEIKEQKVLYEHNLFDSHVGLTYSTAFGLLQKIEKELGIKILNYTDISRYDFYSVYTLVALAEKYWEKKDEQ